MGLTISARWTCIKAITKSELKSATSERQHDSNAPAGFQAMMNRVLAPYLGKFCVLYLDDVLIYTQAADEHLEHFQLVLREL
jgi:hypothetical protein